MTVNMMLKIGIYLIIGYALILGLTGCRSKLTKADGRSHNKDPEGCTTEDIKLAINPSNHGFPKQLDKCASDAWGNADKTSKCLKIHYPALSETCVGCFGKMASCSASHCKFKCISDHFSEKCLNCANTNCRNEKKNGSFSLIECTGLKPNELPASK
jgi:hypothetical protein